MKLKFKDIFLEEETPICWDPPGSVMRLIKELRRKKEKQKCQKKNKSKK